MFQRLARTRPAPLALAALAALLWTSAPAGPAHAQSGVLDPTFGAGGVVVAPLGPNDEFGEALAIQADDRIVVAGYAIAANDDFAVARFNLDGTLDASFGGTGAVVTPIGSDVDRAFAVAVQPDQKIVVAGFRRQEGVEAFALARYLPDGTLDPTFDGDGKVVTQIGSLEDTAYAVAVQGDGKIVAAGFTRTSQNKDLAVVRYLPNGSLDPAFGAAGKAVLHVGGDDEAAAIAIQGDGKIVVAGYTSVAGRDLLVVRFTATGLPDPTFNGTGFQVVEFGTGNSFGEGVVLEPGGKILAAGYAHVGSVDHFAVTRLTASGALDPTLAGTGKLTTPVGTTAQGQAIALDANGRFVVAGTARISGNDDVAIVRYNADGSIDTAFGGTGIVTQTLGTGADQGKAVAIQSDAKVLAAGTARSGNFEDFGLVRYLIDDCGNGTIDLGEECDGGAVIGGDCCTTACTLLGAGTVCRPADGFCDLEESCDGVSGVCPADLRKPDGDDDGVCDEIDICPVDPDPAQLDGDDDGLGDACDPCTNGVTIGKPKMRITKFTSGPGDDTFTFTGDMDFAFEPVIDAVAVGARVILEDANGEVLFDVAVPPGAYSSSTRSGWRANKAGTMWSFRSQTPVGGVVNMLRFSTTKARRDLAKVRVTGRKGGFAQSPVALPLSAIVVIDAPTAATGACGEIHYVAAPGSPSCTFNASGSTLQCK